MFITAVKLFTIYMASATSVAGAAPTLVFSCFYAQVWAEVAKILLAV